MNPQNSLPLNYFENPKKLNFLSKQTTFQATISLVFILNMFVNRHFQLPYWVLSIPNVELF